MIHQINHKERMANLIKLDLTLFNDKIKFM